MVLKQVDYGKTSIVRIRNEEAIFGAGFMISDEHLLTCCHVLADYAGISREEKVQPNKIVQVDFPLVNPDILTNTEIVYWNQEKDIAILEIAADDDFPLDADFSILCIQDNQMNDEYIAFGFPFDSPDGVWSVGNILNPTARGWYQIERSNAQGKAVVQGFSGTLLWNKSISQVVGMVVASDLSPEAKVAYFIPTQKIIEAIPEKAIQEILPYLVNQKNKLTLPDSSYHELRDAFEGLDFDNDQEYNFYQHFKKEKFFAFIIHGEDEEYGQQWLYNRLIRKYRLSQKEIIKYQFKGIGNGRTLKDFLDNLSTKLKIFGKQNIEAIVKRLLKYLHSREVIFIIKSPSVKLIKDILIPFCESILKSINKHSPKNRLIFFIHIEEVMPKAEIDNLIVWNKPLPVICNERFKNWLELLESPKMICPLVSSHYKSECLLEKPQHELDEHCKEIILDLVKIELEDDILYKLDENDTKPEIPAGRFMKETVNNLQLSWQKFEEKWIRY